MANWPRKREPSMRLGQTTRPRKKAGFAMSASRRPRASPPMIPAPKRRWLRFSLRTLFVVVTVFGIWLGWQTNVVRERRTMRDWLEARGGGVVPVEFIGFA